MKEVDRTPIRTPYVLRTPEDTQTAQEVRTKVAEWYAGTAQTLDIGHGWSSAQRALCHSTLEEMSSASPNAWVGYYSATMGEFPSKFIQVTRATRQQHQQYLEAVREQKLQDIEVWKSVPTSF